MLLVGQLLFVELGASCVLIFFRIVVHLNPAGVVSSLLSSFQIEIFLFLIFVLLKLLLSIHLIFQWLNTYYELWPTFILHRQGLMLRQEEKYIFERISTIGLDQGLLGKLFNFGSILLFEKDMKKYVTIYDIHDPERYMEILQSLIPNVNIESQRVRNKVIEFHDVHA